MQKVSSTPWCPGNLCSFTIPHKIFLAWLFSCNNILCFFWAWPFFPPSNETHILQFAPYHIFLPKRPVEFSLHGMTARLFWILHFFFSKFCISLHCNFYLYHFILLNVDRINQYQWQKKFQLGVCNFYCTVSRQFLSLLHYYVVFSSGMKLLFLCKTNKQTNIFLLTNY